MTAAAPGFPEIRPVGLGGVLVTFSAELTDEANRAALGLRDLIEAERIEGVLETSTSLVSTFVAYDPLRLSAETLRTRLGALISRPRLSTSNVAKPHRLWRIPTAFGGSNGPQLDEAAKLAGVTPERAIKEITAKPLRVIAIGFAPGQPYLGRLPDNWSFPRMGGLTPQVPAASIVVAIRQLVLFANASPTGWRYIGQTAFRVFRREAPDPFAFRPGDEVQLIAISADDLDAIRSRDDGGNGGAQCETIA